MQNPRMIVLVFDHSFFFFFSIGSLGGVCEDPGLFGLVDADVPEYESIGVKSGQSTIHHTYHLLHLYSIYYRITSIGMHLWIHE